MKDPKPLLSGAAMHCNLDYFEALIKKHKEEIQKVQIASIEILSKKFDHSTYVIVQEK